MYQSTLFSDPKDTKFSYSTLISTKYSKSIFGFLFPIYIISSKMYPSSYIKRDFKKIEIPF